MLLPRPVVVPGVRVFRALLRFGQGREGGVVAVAFRHHDGKQKYKLPSFISIKDSELQQVLPFMLEAKLFSRDFTRLPTTVNKVPFICEEEGLDLVE